MKYYIIMLLSLLAMSCAPTLIVRDSVKQTQAQIEQGRLENAKNALRAYLSRAEYNLKEQVGANITFDMQDAECSKQCTHVTIRTLVHYNGETKVIDFNTEMSASGTWNISIWEAAEIF